MDELILHHYQLLVACSVNETWIETKVYDRVFAPDFQKAEEMIRAEWEDEDTKLLWMSLEQRGVNGTWHREITYNGNDKPKWRIPTKGDIAAASTLGQHFRRPAAAPKPLSPPARDDLPEPRKLAEDGAYCAPGKPPKKGRKGMVPWRGEKFVWVGDWPFLAATAAEAELTLGESPEWDPRKPQTETTED